VTDSPRLALVLHHGIESGAELAAYARLAERGRFESLWVTERYCHEETVALLGYLAATTDRVKLGVGVVNPYTRHPVLLAMAAATLDRVSSGRLLLGLGRSERDVIQDRLGVPYERPRRRLADTVSVVRRLLAGERLDEPGARGVRLALAPVQASVPIYLAAIGPRALRLAGRIADGVLLNAYAPVGYVRWAVAEVAAAARAAGRDPAAVDIACMLVVRLTDDPASLGPALRRRLARLLDEPHVGELLLEKGGFDATILPRLRAAMERGSEAEAAGLVTEAMLDAFYVRGPAAVCRARIGDYRAAGAALPLLLPPLSSCAEVAERLAGA